MFCRVFKQDIERKFEFVVTEILVVLRQCLREPRLRYSRERSGFGEKFACYFPARFQCLSVLRLHLPTPLAETLPATP